MLLYFKIPIYVSTASKANNKPIQFKMSGAGRHLSSTRFVPGTTGCTTSCSSHDSHHDRINGNYYPHFIDKLLELRVCQVKWGHPRGKQRSRDLNWDLSGQQCDALPGTRNGRTRRRGSVPGPARPWGGPLTSIGVRLLSLQLSPQLFVGPDRFFQTFSQTANFLYMFH